MRLRVLGSGSSGNCYILENDNEALIIEAGLPFMEVKKALDFNVMKIAGVLASHIHGDHAKYIGEYEKAGVPVWKPYDTDFYKSCDMKEYGTFEVRTFPNQDKDRRWLHNNSDGSEWSVLRISYNTPGNRKPCVCHRYRICPVAIQGSKSYLM